MRRTRAGRATGKVPRNFTNDDLAADEAVLTALPEPSATGEPSPSGGETRRRTMTDTSNDDGSRGGLGAVLRLQIELWLVVLFMALAFGAGILITALYEGLRRRRPACRTRLARWSRHR